MDKKIYDLTNNQNSILLINQFYNMPNSINNIAGYLKIEVSADFYKLESAFNEFVKKNDAFRIRLIETKEGIKQYVKKYEYKNISTVTLDDTCLEDYIQNFASSPFDVLNDDLYKVEFIKLPNDNCIILLNLHHIISDAWTMIFCLNEVYSFYNKLLNNEAMDTESSPSYFEYLDTQKLYLNSEKFLKDKTYWEDKFSVLPDTISFKNGLSTQINSERMSFCLPNSLVEQINLICRENNISQYIFLLSVFSIYFRNIFNSNNYIIGNPILNRSNYREKHTAGAFVSVTPFIVNVNDEISFLENAKNIAIEQLGMYKHVKYPAENIFEYIRKKYNTTDKLYDIVFSYQNAKISSVSSDTPISAKWIPNSNQIESLMIHIKDTEDMGKLDIYYDYLIDLFTKEDMQRMHNRILNIITQVIKKPNMLINDIDILDSEEINELIYTLNPSPSSYNKSSNIVSEFEEQVEMHPNSVAVSCSGNSITYKELNTKANFIANKLVKLGFKNEIIAFKLERSVDIIITIIGILKSGNTYMPIDSEYPFERINFMLSNSKSKLLITNNDLIDKIDFDGQIIFYKDLNFNTEYDNLNINIPAETNAYIMYTSGSTGIPKAVTIMHYNVLNFVKSMQQKLNYKFSEKNIVLSVTTVCFDIFVFEIFPTLLSGLHLVISTEAEAKNPKLLNDCILKNKVTKILTTPSRIQLLFMDSEYTNCLKQLEEIILGGEPFPHPLLKDLQCYTKSSIYNLYGPTETTVYSTFKDLTLSSDITIGQPIANTQIYILNDNNKIMPKEVVGEICIAGDGVGAGYYKNTDLTTKSFIKNPYKDNDILYKTGDLGKWTKDNELICFGRKDHQIKIRGYRIELGDISNNMLEYPGILKSVVIDLENEKSEKILCAYFVSNTNINISDLKRFLLSKLPNYMIPNHFIRLDDIPLTLNHKIDRKSLPKPTFSQPVNTEFIEPKTKTEKVLCRIIEEELNINSLGITDDLFNYNIDSLAIIRIQTKLLPYNLNLKTQDFYTYTTVEKLASKADKLSDIPTEEEYDEHTLKELNSVINNSDIKLNQTKYNNILLSGATGFLGIHILNRLISETTSHLYCIVRRKYDQSSLDRLIRLYDFYFKSPLPLDRITIIDSVPYENNLGLSDLEYEKLLKTVDLVINATANVRYYGKYSDFKKINVTSTKMLADFCLNADIQFIQISTTGVSGNYLVSNKNGFSTFNENDFYIGQKYQENVYIYTKFESEKLIYSYMNNGLKACIIRVGNLTARFADGHFQKNFFENAFYNMLKIILNYKIIPFSMTKQFLEFTPIDLCSAAIIKLILGAEINKNVLHVFNNNYISVKDLLEALKNLGYNIKSVDTEEFNKKILEITKEDKSVLKGIVNDLDAKEGLSFKPTVAIENEITNCVLKSLGFSWPTLDDNYISKLIKYMENEKYI